MTINDGDKTTTSNPYTITDLTMGTHVITCYLIDKAGNISSALTKSDAKTLVSNLYEMYYDGDNETSYRDGYSITKICTRFTSSYTGNVPVRTSYATIRYPTEQTENYTYRFC